MGVDDDPPVIEVVGAEPEVRSEAVVASGSRWSWRHGVAVAAGAVVVALIVLGGDDGGSPDDDTAGVAATTTSTTTTTTTATAPAGEYLTGREAPVFDGAVGASVLVGDVERGWRHVDLDTGYVEPVPVLDGVAPDELLPVRGGVIVLQPQNPGRAQLVPLHTGEAVDAKRLDFWPDVSDGRVSIVEAVLGSGSPDRFWVVSQPLEPGRERAATLVAASGERLVGPFALPVQPVAGTAAGLVYNAGGRVHLIGPDGTSSLGPGEAHAASADAVGLVVCDEAVECRLGVVSVETGDRRTGGTLDLFDLGRAEIEMDVSATGAVAVLTQSPRRLGDNRTQLPRATLHVAGAGAVNLTADVESARAGPAWLPDGRGVLISTVYGLHRYHEVDGQLVAERVQGLRTSRDTALFVVER